MEYANIGATSGIVSLLAVLGYGLYKLLVHAHCKSACCARPMFDVYVNLEEDTDSLPILPAPTQPATRQV